MQQEGTLLSENFCYHAVVYGVYNLLIHHHSLTHSILRVGTPSSLRMSLSSKVPKTAAIVYGRYITEVSVIGGETWRDVTHITA